MNKKQASEIANKLFDTYPTVNTFFITADGQAFEVDHNAHDHAKHLDAKKPIVFDIERSAAAVTIEEEETYTHVLTAEDFERNPELGNDPELQVGDSIEIPVGVSVEDAFGPDAQTTITDAGAEAEAKKKADAQAESELKAEATLNEQKEQEAKAKEEAAAKKAASIAKAKATKAKNAAAKAK